MQLSFPFLSAAQGRGLLINSYDGSLPGFLTFLAKHQLSGLALPEWSSGATIDYFDGPDGKRLRYAHWPHASEKPALGTIVHFNGRTEFIERNIRTYSDLAGKGWDIWTLDWRGQGLSYRPLVGEKAVRGHIDAFTTYVGDAAAFIDTKIKLKEQPGLHVLLAHSMGGQVALRYLLDNPKAFDRVILSSPLVGLRGGWVTAADALLKEDLRTWPQVSERCAPKEEETWKSSFNETNETACGALDKPNIGRLPAPAVAAPYSHDAGDLAIGECLVEASLRNGDPGLAVACPTGGWLAAARTSIAFVNGNLNKEDNPSKLPMPNFHRRGAERHRGRSWRRANSMQQASALRLRSRPPRRPRTPDRNAEDPKGVPWLLRRVRRRREGRGRNVQGNRPQRRHSLTHLIHEGWFLRLASVV